jgi:lipopolysaccharide export LptBFGC system permease protein LptF
MEQNKKGINLSDISYDENGEIVFKDINYDENGEIIFNDIDQKENNEELDINKPLEENEKTKPMTSEEKAANLSQTIEEIEQDMKAQKKRKQLQESIIYMNEKNTMFLSCCIFTLLGLSFGTFVFSDYITCTLIGLLMGIISGKFLCKQIKKEESNKIND